eukprot:1859230-Prymnesium_polylepis.1
MPPACARFEESGLPAPFADALPEPEIFTGIILTESFIPGSIISLRRVSVLCVCGRTVTSISATTLT